MYLGDLLGGFRTGGYEEYTKTSHFEKGLKEVIKYEKAALMCAEKLPWKCHRKLIGVELQRRGIEVIHIIDKDRVWIPELQTKL